MYRPLPSQRKILSPIQRLQIKPKQKYVQNQGKAITQFIQIDKVMQEIQNIKTDFETWFTNKMSETQKAIDEMQKIQREEMGFVGPKGEKGDSIVGPVGPRGEKGDSIVGPVGPRGEKGDVGDTPVAGLDFPMPKDGIDGKHADPDAVIARLKSLPVGKRLKPEHIDGLKSTLDVFSRQLSEHKFSGQMKGGGDTVVAGAGVTITFSSSTGKKTISAVPSVLTPTGSVNGVNTTFVFTTAPTIIFVDGGRAMQKTSSDGTVNWTGTTTVVLTVAPKFDIWGM